MWLLLLGLTSCGLFEDSPGSPTAQHGPNAVPRPASPIPAENPPAVEDNSCFGASRWATPACDGDGHSAPPWWGPKRWPSLKLRGQRTIQDARGRTHFTMNLVRDPKLATAGACATAIKQSLSGRFPAVETLPSTMDTRASMRGRSARYEVTAVCGMSARGESLVHVDLMPLAGKKP